MRIQKTFIVLFTIAMGIVSCAPKNTEQRNPENEALVKKYMNAVVTGDTSKLEEFLAENYMSYGPRFTDSIDRAGTVADFKNNWRKNWSTVDFSRYTMLSSTTTEGPVAGDWVLDWAKITIHSKNKTPSYTVNWHAVFRVKDGKIDREIDFFNEADILSQIGFTFVPPADSATVAK